MADLTALPLTNDVPFSQFELVVEGHTARLEYQRDGKRMFLTHTEVPPALEGQGVGRVLVEKVLAYIEEAGMRIVPVCPFVAAYLRRHPEWQRLLEKGVQL